MINFEKLREKIEELKSKGIYTVAEFWKSVGYEVPKK